MRISHRILTACALVLVLTVGIPLVASATVFFCGSGDVDCVIRSIERANARRGPDTIILEAGTYSFTVADNTVDVPSAPFFGVGNALPSITGRVTIQGAGPTETILDGSHLPFTEGTGLRLFHIAASGRLTLHGLTIRNGFAGGSPGGAIFNRGTLTVSQTVIRDSFCCIPVGGPGGGGIYSVGTLRIVDSRITNNIAFVGGGILSSGSLHVLRSTIDNNIGDEGGAGGIFTSGTTTIKDSAIAENRAVVAGGGGLVIGGTDTTVSITNTTIAHNGGDFGGGLLVDSGTVLLTNVTVADNGADLFGGGGLFVDTGATVSAQNTILARNKLNNPFSPFLGGPDCNGSITSLGNNIIGNTEGCIVDLASIDFVGDAGLGVFVDNDHIPGHAYIPLLAESPAIDAGNRAACPRRDQLRNRRVDVDDDRPVRCDIGALEFIPTP